MPGASLVDLIKAVVRSPSRHDMLCILSNANKVVSMNWARYEQTTRQDVWDAVKDLAEHIKNNAVSKHIILFGADVSLFEGAAFPDDYRRIQVDILNMLSLVGLNAGTGMEPHYGDFGRFRGKLDRNWHIQGVYREEACAFIGAVLAATSSLMVVDTGPSEPEPSSSSMALEASSSSPLIGIGSLDGGGHVNRARQTFSFDLLQESPEKESWIKIGRERGYRWPRCAEQTSLKVVLCPVDAEEGTVLVCTSGDKQTEAQTHLTCQMLHSLGWKPHIIVGVGQADMPPTSWKVGCKATLAWYVSVMPQILACAEALGNEECLMVAEDSLWPSDLLTPQLVYEKLARRKKALWLAALMPPKEYKHVLGDIDISARAPAGSKCFCGNKDFWRNVDFLFDVTDKNWSTDAIFQTMVGLCELELVHPFLGATMPHVSMRTGHVSSHGLAAANIAGTLLPLPSGWKKSLGPMMASGKIFEC